MQFWPRCKAKRIHTRVRSWPKSKEQRVLGFAGYKAGMTHIMYTDTKKNSPTVGLEVTVPVTIIECPPIKPISIHFYSSDAYGLKLSYSTPLKDFDKSLKRKLSLPKKEVKEKEVKLDNIKEVRVLVQTLPKLTGIGKKKPEVFELSLPSENVEEAHNFAKSIIGKEIKVSEIFKAGEYIDVHGVTKGFGFTGPIKRFGISLKSHKSEKKRRSAGNLGAWTPSKVSPTVPQHGQHGFHTRTAYNNLIFAVEQDVKKINQKGGIKRYGEIKNEYLLIKGSVPGPRKRLIKLIPTIRDKKAEQLMNIEYISTSSKQ